MARIRSTVSASCPKRILPPIRTIPAATPYRVSDRVIGRLVTNNYPDITIDFETQFTAYHREGAPDLYPAHLRGEIDALNAVLYEDVNNGVYKAGFATTQTAYEEAVDALFARLDWLEERLSRQRFLFGDQITESSGCSQRLCASTPSIMGTSSATCGGSSIRSCIVGPAGDAGCGKVKHGTGKRSI